MSLENIECPQFVDFTRNETFDINDGADFLFERRVMGEGLDLGMFGENFENASSGNRAMSNDNGVDAGVEQITNILSNATNLNKHQENTLSHNSKPNQPVKAHQQQTTHQKTTYTTAQNVPNTSAAKPSTQNKENNSNTMVKTTTSISKTSSSLLGAASSSATKSSPNAAVQIGGSTASVVSSAIELMSTSSSLQSNKPSTQTHALSKAPNTPIGKQQQQNQLTLAGAGVSKKQQQPQPSQPPQYNNSNIVKKTFAKMTAAFKQAKPMVNEQQNIKAKLSQNCKQNNNTKASKLAKDDFRLGNKHMMEQLLDATVANASGGGNRRASSVPRTLREKQELKKMAAKDSVVNDILKDNNEEEEEEEDVETMATTATAMIDEKNLSLVPPTQTATLGEKIQNFFNSHHTSNGNASAATTAAGLTVNNGVMVAGQKTKQAMFSKSKFASAFSGSTGGPMKVLPSSKAAPNMADRRRSRSCNEAVRLSKQNNGAGAVAIAANPRKSRLPTSESIDLSTVNKNTSINKNTSLVSSTNSNGNNRGVVGKAVRSPSVNKSHVERQRSAERSTPQIAMYQGVKFVPKIAPKYQYSNESDKLDEILKNRPISLSKQQQQQSSDNMAKKSSPNKRGPTPSKTGSFKQHQSHSQATHGKLNTSSSIDSTHNIHRQNNLKQSTQNACAKKPPSSMGNSIINTSSDIASTGVGGANTTCNLTRKKSECKPVLMSSNANTTGLGNTSGLMMHTELRAQKRSEYDQHQKEKERQALLLRRDMEEEKMRRQQEEIQKIRMQRHTFRSRPIKYYKPVEVKPSEKPLTEPVSPQLGTSLSTSSHTINQTSHYNNNNSTASNIRHHNSTSKLKSASSMLSLHNYDMADDVSSMTNNLSMGPKMKAQNGSLNCLNNNGVRSKMMKSDENLNSEFKF